MRMFAGPNGSGKSSLNQHLPKELLGIYLNPDELERQLRTTGVLDFGGRGLTAIARQSQTVRHCRYAVLSLLCSVLFCRRTVCNGRR